MEVTTRATPLPVRECKVYHNATLHVSARGTIHNLFHALNDNMLPIMTQTLLDLFLYPEVARLPRMSLLGFHIPSHHKRAHPRGGVQVPHLAIFDKLFEAGHVDVNEMDGMCFRRVVWGTGLRIHYVDALVALRRLTADFARALVIRAFDPPLPPAFQLQTNRTGPFVIAGKPLKMLLVTRGDGGLGRSIQREAMIVRRLESGGALVTICCDFGKTDLTTQLSYAVHADVIIGLHGAGLVNAIFAPRGCLVVELKTLYGYSTDIFLRTTDARRGTHVHIDVRDYSTPGQVHRVDSALTERVYYSIATALRLQREGVTGRIVKISNSSNDFVIGPANTDRDLADLLGPPISRLHKVCKEQLVYWDFRKLQLGGKDSTFCSSCGED
mmetsp:Transcript_18941/g.19059  ORF Transcript_18941/g.19059 Transcript_18941/m.19059 type:complete len:384 (+) Transcript_18941:1-1152(+)